MQNLIKPFSIELHFLSYLSNLKAFVSSGQILRFRFIAARTKIFALQRYGNRNLSFVVTKYVVLLFPTCPCNSINSIREKERESAICLVHSYPFIVMYPNDVGLDAVIKFSIFYICCKSFNPF